MLLVLVRICITDKVTTFNDQCAVRNFLGPAVRNFLGPAVRCPGSGLRPSQAISGAVQRKNFPRPKSNSPLVPSCRGKAALLWLKWLGQAKSYPWTSLGIDTRLVLQRCVDILLVLSLISITVSMTANGLTASVGQPAEGKPAAQSRRLPWREWPVGGASWRVV